MKYSKFLSELDAKNWMTFQNTYNLPLDLDAE